MQRLRDILIIAVLGGVVIYFIVGFLGRLHHESVELSVVVRQAETQCILMGMTCNFTSEKEAQDFLNRHKPAEADVKVAEEKKKADEAHNAELNRRVEELLKRGTKAVKSACRKDRTLNCALIDEGTARTFAESIVENQLVKEKGSAN